MSGTATARALPRALPWLLALLLAVPPNQAWAQSAPAPPAPSAAERAAQLKQQGNEALGALRPGDALEAYKEAYAIAPEPALHYNMGHALEALGDYPDALAEYEEFARVAPPDLKARVPRLTELIAEMRGRVTLVSIHCNVPGARVLIRDVAVGTTGGDGNFSHAFPAGAAMLEVTADGYAPTRQHALFTAGGVAQFEIVLVTTATAGVLRVTTTPVLGDVYVDDKLAGHAPVEASVAAGPHRIVVKSSGMRDTATQTVVGVGETREVTVDLEKTTPVYAQWWFWTTIGVVVVGGVVITYAAFKARAADSGSIPPGQLPPQGEIVYRPGPALFSF
jgi:hypothetical protein